MQRRGHKAAAAPYEGGSMRHVWMYEEVLSHHQLAHNKARSELA